MFSSVATDFGSWTIRSIACNASFKNQLHKNITHKPSRFTILVFLLTICHFFIFQIIFNCNLDIIGLNVFILIFYNMYHILQHTNF